MNGCEKNFNLVIYVSTGTMMDRFEKAVKINVLFSFSVLNILDMVQTWAFLGMGIEGNPIAVGSTSFWYLFKAIFAFGLPLGLYRLDKYLDGKADEGLVSYLNEFVGLAYVMVLFADIFFLFLVLKNSHVLTRVSCSRCPSSIELT